MSETDGKNTDQYAQWQSAAEKQLKGKSIDSLNTETPEGIELKALYTADDLAKLEHTNTMPQCMRGAHGQFVSTLDFLLPKHPISFIVNYWLKAARVSRSLLTYRPTGDTTRTMSA